MWRVERRKRIGWKPWYWEIFLSSAGWADGVAWTKRGAEHQLLRAQSWLMGGD